jgi:hypothetical protein
MAEKIWLKRYPDFFSMGVSIKLTVQVFLQQIFALYSYHWSLAVGTTGCKSEKSH